MDKSRIFVYWWIAAPFVLLLVFLGTSGWPARFSAPALAPSNVAWPQISLQEIASGLTLPTAITHAGDGSGRIFILEQRGRISIYEGGLLAQPFLDISSRVRAPGAGGGSEEGLLGLAFPPGYAAEGYFYVYYTDKDGDNVLSRFHVSNDPSIADPQSEEEILFFHHPGHSNHNGGQLAFGPDGYLYIGTGDGGGGGDPAGNAQDPASLLGKILRIDVEMGALPPQGDYLSYLPVVVHGGQGAPPSFQAYRIPPDNPFVGVNGYREEIWALGLRNPWRFSFDRATGDLYIADVGQQKWEEVNFQPGGSPGGENYGWNVMEGEECYLGLPCDPAGLTLPIHVYRTGVEGCAITGGYVYRGPDFPSLAGIYLFGDYCSGRIWGLQPADGGWTSAQLLDTAYRISTLGEDEAGRLFLADHNAGRIYQILAAEE